MSKFKSPSIHTTPLYRAKAAYSNMLARCENKNGKNKSYSDVKLKMTLEEWLIWSIPRYTAFIESNPNSSPSVSRKEDKGDYEIGNIEIISMRSNREKQVIKKMDDVNLICPNCGVSFIRSGRYVKSKTKGGIHDLLCSRQCSGSWRK